jgi:hypothetical protein
MNNCHSFAYYHEQYAPVVSTARPRSNDSSKTGSTNSCPSEEIVLNTSRTCLEASSFECQSTRRSRWHIRISSGLPGGGGKDGARRKSRFCSKCRGPLAAVVHLYPYRIWSSSQCNRLYGELCKPVARGREPKGINVEGETIVDISSKVDQLITTWSVWWVSWKIRSTEGRSTSDM